MKDRFLGLLGSVNRPGMEKLIHWLTENSDFMTAPASTKYHGAVEGGLLDHSVAVFNQLTYVINSHEIVKASAETAIMCGLLHDVCKANFYKISTRNSKDEKGNWIKVPYYEIEDRFPYGHGEKSVYILNEFIHLTVEEAMAIRWHIGLSDTDYAARCALSAAMEKYPLILALQMADQMATFWDKK